MPLIYIKSSDRWGLLAKDRDLNLVFSGELDPLRICKEALNKLFFKKAKTMVSHDTVDIFQLFNQPAHHVWDVAVWKAIKYGPVGTGCVHLFLALTEDQTIKNVFSRLGADLHDARTLLKNYLTLSPTSAGAEELRHVPFAAFELSEKLHSPNISPLILLGALINILPANHILQAVFSNLGLDAKKLEVLTVWIESLDYEFKRNSFEAELLHACQKLSFLEEHYKIKYRLNVIEQALSESNNKSEVALKLLIKATTKSINKKLSFVSSLNE